MLSSHRSAGFAILAALVGLLSASCARHVSARAATPSAPLVVQNEKDSATEEDDFDRLKIPADPAERRKFYDARKRSIARLGEVRATFGIETPQVVSTFVNPQQWTFIGPQPMVNATNPWAGSVLRLAMDPRNPSTIYAETFVGRLWKTTDAGVTWLPLSDSGPLQFVRAIGFDPTIANSVVVLNEGSLYQSSTGGSTWTELPDVTTDATCSGEAFAVHPTVSGTWIISEYCTGSQASSVIYKTTNSGATWTKQTTITGEVNFIAFNANNGTYAYASGVNGQAVTFETWTDASNIWTNAIGLGPATLPQTASISPGHVEFASAPSDPKTIYVRVETFGSSPVLVTLYKSTDLGLTWSRTNYPATVQGPRTPGLTAIDPQNPKNVFCGDTDLWRSMDGGNTFVRVDGMSATTGLHSDNHAMIFTPDGNTMYESNDGGVWSSTTFRAAAITWNSINATFGTAEFSDQMALDPTNPNRTFGGLQDNTSIEYFGTLAWPLVGLGGDGRGNELNPQNPNTVYSINDGDLARSTTGGLPGSWSSLQKTGSGRFVMDLRTPANLYLWNQSEILQTTNGGDKWNPWGPANFDFANFPTVSVALSDSNAALVKQGSFVWITSNALAGAKTTFTSGLPLNSALSLSNTQKFVIHPSSPKTVYGLVKSSNPSVPLAESQDGGVTWQARDFGPNVNDNPRDLVVDPDIPGVMYLGTESAVFRSSDFGATWYPLGTGFPVMQVTNMQIQRASRILRVSTGGRGAWDLAIPRTAPIVSGAVFMPNPSAFLLTVTGNNFSTNSAIWINGRPLPTSYVSDTQLITTLLPNALVLSTVYYAAVYTPGATGGLSDPVMVSVGPTIYASGIQNAAGPVSNTSDSHLNSFAVGLSPGMFTAIYGLRLASSTVVGSYPFQTSLGGVQVMVNGIAAPIYYVSPSQIDFVVPWETPVGMVQVVVMSGTVSSNAITMKVEVAPQIFTTNQQGSGQAAVLIAGTPIIAAPSGGFPGSRPAMKGEYLSIYLTGLGAVQNEPADGAPATGLFATVAQPTVDIGCLDSSGELAFCPATVLFSGLAPGFVGLYQVNIQVPQTANSGSTVPLRLLPVTGRPSNIVTIAVE